jgi:hypothetical protein
VLLLNEHYAMKAYWGRRRRRIIAPLILFLGIWSSISNLVVTCSGEVVTFRSNKFPQIFNASFPSLKFNGLQSESYSNFCHYISEPI